jgi:hypothetical protein
MCNVAAFSSPVPPSGYHSTDSGVHVAKSGVASSNRARHTNFSVSRHISIPAERLLKSLCPSLGTYIITRERLNGFS